MTAGLETVFLKAKRAEQRGDEPEARRILEEVLRKYPQNRKAMGGIARLNDLRAGNGGAAQVGLDEMLRCYAARDFAGAVQKGEALVARFPDAADIWNLLGACYLDLDAGEAERCFRTAIGIDPKHEAAHNNLELLYRRRSKEVDLEQFYRNALRANPVDANAVGKLAGLYLDNGRKDEALATCNAALRIDPRHATAHYWIGNAHMRAKEHLAAIEWYMKALTIKADHFDATFNLGHALYAMGNFHGAIDVYHQATLVDPNSANAHMKFGDVLRLGNMMDKAQLAFRRALELNPTSGNLKAQLLYQEAIICDWHARHEFADIPTSPKPGDGAIPPFVALTFEDDAARQLERSRSLVKADLNRPASDFRAPERQAGSKIRIGYFSSDFHDHATLHLISGLLREHDRERFEIRIYSFGGQSDVMADRVSPFVDAVIDIRDLTDEQAVKAIRADALDVAVDLKGYTTGTRMELFVDRIAPVQIAWLGYPGSVGDTFIDYMIADSVVIPEGAEHHYSERIIRIPGSYQANDNQRIIGSCPDDRTQLGLPAEGFVFCCFNQNYKIGPKEYDIWMRLLAQVEGSVLWLIRSNPTAENNLRREAEARGIDPARIVFAEKMAHKDHLARHRHADLFLDTFAVNAHTTASDALWSGLPVVTLAGEQFAARVAASLLTAIDMPDFVTATAADYEAKALELALSPEKLTAAKARLAANRLTTALYDTVGHTRNMEAAYAAAYQRSLDGLTPDHITLG